MTATCRGPRLAGLAAMVLSAIAAVVLLPLGAEGVGTTPIPPRPSGAPVLDRVGILSPAAHRTLVALESRLTSERNGAEVGVLVVDTLNGDNPRAFATDVYNAWGVGDATADNGAIIMVAKDDHAIQSIFGAVGSVHYDVWACTACDRALVLRYGKLLTHYKPCPQCGAKTKSATSTAVRSATTTSTGLARIDETCANCSFYHSYTKTIPKDSTTTSDSSLSSGSGSGSSGGGGGHSSGGGSSGSW